MQIIFLAFYKSYKNCRKETHFLEYKLQNTVTLESILFLFLQEFYIFVFLTFLFKKLPISFDKIVWFKTLTWWEDKVSFGGCSAMASTFGWHGGIFSLGLAVTKSDLSVWKYPESNKQQLM